MHNNLRTFSDMQAGNCLSRTIIDASWLPNPGGTATSIGAPFLHFRINHGPPKRPGGGWAALAAPGGFYISKSPKNSV